ncbi:MAG: FAD-dependent thymidylate synthase [Oligoflexia bacterium]|nr:FAD-dependent thymidylate synthase [Oligoflexia bacterium]
MAHLFTEEAERILDKEFKVLDKGFIRLVDYFGNDARIVQTARVSYGEGTKTVREDKSLIDYLWRNEHSSPFEHVVFTFHCKLPIFVARQWIRHRTARVNEISGRYSVMKNEFYVPDESEIQFQSGDNKQGRSEEEVPSDLKQKVLDILSSVNDRSYNGYNEMVESGIARELARVSLPLSLYTEWYWQIDLKNLFHFLKLRLDIHAQYEIRKYAEVMSGIVQKVCPYAWEAFEEHTLKSVKLSSGEQGMLKDIIEGRKVDREGRLFRILSEKLPFLRESGLG